MRVELDAVSWIPSLHHQPAERAAPTECHARTMEKVKTSYRLLQIEVFIKIIKVLVSDNCYDFEPMPRGRLTPTTQPVFLAQWRYSTPCTRSPAQADRFRLGHENGALPR